MKLALLGINFKTAPVALRERLSFSAVQLPEALRRLMTRLHGSELVLISTCNRTELYAAAQDTPDAAAMRAALLAEVRDTQPAAADGNDAEGSAFYAMTHDAAVEHLLAVAASLDSMVVGETEILGQVKQAYAIAGEAKSVGPVLHQVFQTAFRVAKQVHAETDIARGRVSVSSIAVEFAERVFENLATKTAMIVGAGETAELALRSLVDRGVRDILVLNRSPDRARVLAEAHGGKPIPYHLLSDYLAKADLILTSTSAPQPLVRAPDVRAAAETRRGRPILLVDLAVPRNIEAACGEVENVYLYHIDDLQRIADENLQARRASVDTAWEIVRTGAREMAKAPSEADLALLFKQIDQHVTGLREDAIRRCLARPHLDGLSEDGRAEIVNMVQKMTSKLLATPRDALKRAARDGNWEEYARVTRGLFDLDDDSQEPL